MNLFQNISIRSRFNLISFAVITLILVIVFFFIYTFNKINSYNTYNESIDQLKMHYLNVRRFEQHFLLRYSEDPKFFVSGENKYIDKLKEASAGISAISTDLLSNPITQDLGLTDNIYKIETIHTKYIKIFDDLSEKIFLKGSINSGIIGDLKSSENQVSNNPNSVSNKIINDMIQSVNDYLYTNDEKYYTEFLKIFQQISPSYTPQQLTGDSISINDQTTSASPSNANSNPYNKLKSNFTSLVKINTIIGSDYEKGLEGELRAKSHEFDIPIEELVVKVHENKEKIANSAIRNIYIFFILLTILFLYLFLRFSNSIVRPLNRLKKFIEPLSLGFLPEDIAKPEGKNEISEITESVNNLIIGLKNTTSFASAIGEGKYSTEFKPLSNKDALSNALIEMRENLIISANDETIRKYEDEIRTWANEGLTKFNDILRQNQGNIKEMSIAVISELVKFTNANQGGMFVFNDEEDDKYLELTATYAYGHEKKKEKKIYPGEGLVGTVALEKETVYMTEIPETYITITSGLGGATPKSLLIVPMIIEQKVIGVIEMASFNELKNHEIKFVETLSENIASSLSITKINQRTAILLEQSQKQAEMMKVQEEEMRQNFEELQQVQEDSSRKAAEMTSILSAIDASSLVIEIDIEGKIISANRGLLDMLGVPENVISGMNHQDFIQAEDENEYKEFWSQLMNHENIQRNEHIKIDDKEFWLSVVYAPIIDDTGSIIYILTIATDLNESKKLEFELKTQEAILRQNIEEINKAKAEAEKKQHILENTNEMLTANEKTLHSAVENAMKQRKEITLKTEQIAEEEALSKSRLEGINQTNITVEFDLKGQIISVNKIFENVFKYSEKEVISKSHTFLLKKEYADSEAYTKIWDELLKGLHVSGNFNFIGKDNKKIFLQGTFTAIKDRRGKTSKIFFIAFETTDLIIKTEELKARETELQFQIEDMQMLQDQSVKQQEELTIKAIQIAEREAISEGRYDGINRTNIVIEFGMDGNIVFVNEIFTHTFGYTEKEVVTKHHNMIITEELAKSDQYKNAWKSLKEGNHVTGEFFFIGKNKQKIFIQGTYTAIKDAQGETSKILLMGFDITDHIKRTEELKARETELQFQIEDLNNLQNQFLKQQEELTVKSIEIAEKEAASESRFDGIKNTNIIAEFDMNGDILDVNDIFIDTFGYKKDELISKHHNLIITEDLANSDQYKQAWSQLISGHHITDEFMFLGKGKKKLFIKGTYTAIKNASGETHKILLMGFDNTELIMRSEELKARETELSFQIEELKMLQEKLKP